MAGATYSVNIELNQAGLDAQLGRLKTKLSGLGKQSSANASTAKKEVKTQTTLNNLLNSNAVQYGRALKLKQKGLNIDEQTLNYNIAADKAVQGKLKAARELISFNRLTNTEKNNELLKEGKIAKANEESLKKERLKIKAVHDLNNARLKNFNLRSRLDDLDTQGIKVDKLRLKYGNLNTAQGKRDFNLFKDIGSQLNLSLKKEERKLRIQQRQTRELNKQLRILSRRSNNMASPIRGNAIRDVGSPAWVDRSARMGGPRSRLNYQRGRLLPGPVGSGGGRGGGGSVWQSAAISGAFPLLFGQGPVTAAAGALGGGLGARFGGQMGGFAGGLVATSVASSISQFTSSVATLGKALNENTKDVGALSASLGITGTEFEKNLKTLEKLGGEEAAFEAARKKMIGLVGQQGVDALSKFGRGTTELANQFTIAMTQMRASFARAFGNTGIGRALTNQLTNANLIRQAKVSTDTGVVAAMKRYKQSQLPGWRQSAEFKKNPISVNQAIDELIAAQKAANVARDKAASDKLIAGIQAKRIDNIQKEIELLERTAGMSATEFEIESKITEIKKDGAIQDEEAIRKKLEKLYKLKAERDLTKEIAETWKNINSSIRKDITEGIKGLIKGTATWADMLNNVADKFLDIALNQALYGNIMGSYKKGSGLFGIFGRANGGPVTGGSPYVVGERGPELFVPRSGGNIIPNNAMGNVTVNVDASGSAAQGDGPSSEQLGQLIGAAIQNELIRQKRPGGLLG